MDGEDCTKHEQDIENNIDDLVEGKIASIFDYEIKNNPLPCLKEEYLEPFMKSFKIGYIVGDSGTGKSSIINQLIKTGKYEPLPAGRCINNNKSLIQQFKTEDEAMSKLLCVGLSSIPVWFRTYETISNGEKFRADMAVNIKSFLIVDEFTSNLDRLTARCLSSCLKKYVEKHNLSNIILSGCQYDIIPWLQPDFVYDTNINDFLSDYSALPVWECLIADTSIKHSHTDKAEQLERNSYSIDKKKLVLRRTPMSHWIFYSQHHYLSSSLLSNAVCWEIYVKIENIERGIGFIAVSPMPSGTVHNAVREHRIVVIPSCQGIGIGVLISEAIAKHYVLNGYRYFTKTSHPKLGNYRNNSSFWKPTTSNMIKKSNKENSVNKDGKFRRWNVTERVCYSHEYVLVPINKFCPRQNCVGFASDKLITESSIKYIKPIIKIHDMKKDYKIEKLEWLPLKIIGTMKRNDNGDVVVRIDHKRIKFTLETYGDDKKALSAAQEYIIQENINKRVNLYTMKDNKIYVDISNSNDGSLLLIIDEDGFDLISGVLWRERNKRAFTMRDGKRVYIEEILYPKMTVEKYIDGNKLNNTKSNIEFKHIANN